jgi:dihydroneopterin aldolase
VSSPTPGTDRIELRGLRVVARCGVLPEEVERPQPFELDLDLHTDLRAAGASDDLTDTVDYGAVCDAVVAVAAERHHGLMEHLAERIASVVLDDPRVSAVDVTMRKVRPPVPHDLGTSGVAIHRARAADGEG